MFGRRWRLLCGLALAWAITGSGVAEAHARLIRSNPEDGAVLIEAPRHIYLWFDEPVEAKFASARLLDAEAHLLAEASLTAQASHPTLLVAAVPEVPAGVYSLSWTVVSEIDNHITKGTLVFGVNRATENVTRSALAVTPLMEAGLRWWYYAALALLIGGLLTAGVIFTPASSFLDTGVAASLREKARWLARLGALLALGAGMVWLWWQSVGLHAGLLELIEGSRLGRLWLIQQGLLGVIWCTLSLGRRARWLSGPAVLGVVTVHSFSSHAAAQPDQAALAMLATAAHLLAAGAWVGSLGVMTIVTWPLWRLPQRRAAALAGWQRFSSLAAASVGVLAGTGLYNTARQVASLDAWIASPYGLTLLAKLGLFLIVGAIGLTNAARLHPRVAAVLEGVLRRPAGWMAASKPGLLGWAAAEAGLGLIALLLSSMLTALPPARGPEFGTGPAIERAPSSLTQRVDDLIISLQVRPNQPGPNILSLGAFSTRRPAPAEIIRVMVRLTYLDQGLGTQTLIAEPVEAGRYRLHANALSLAGAWRAQVVVRRSGLEDSVADFEWRVDPLMPSIPLRPSLVSSEPLAPVLNWLAAGILAATLFGAILWAAGLKPSSTPP